MEKLLSKLQERTESQIATSSVRWVRDTAYAPTEGTFEEKLEPALQFLANP